MDRTGPELIPCKPAAKFQLYVNKHEALRVAFTIPFSFVADIQDSYSLAVVISDSRKVKQATFPTVTPNVLYFQTDDAQLVEVLWAIKRHRSA